jgi:hypothetical protein
MVTAEKPRPTEPDVLNAQIPASRAGPAARGILDGVPFGRSKLLAGAAAGLTTLATKMWFADSARAGHGIPNGCFGYHWCPMCSAAQCVSGCCGGIYCCCPPDNLPNQCWESCAYEGATLYRIKCCDFQECGAGGCICRALLGPC